MDPNTGAWRYDGDPATCLANAKAARFTQEEKSARASLRGGEGGRPPAAAYPLLWGVYVVHQHLTCCSS